MRRVGALYGKSRANALLRLQSKRTRIINWVCVGFSLSYEVSAMLRFAVCNRHGLRFTMYAKDRADACKRVMRMLGKRSVPEYIWIAPY